jgi:diguanylate cyclase (GGDEF)-like protein
MVALFMRIIKLNIKSTFSSACMAFVLSLFTTQLRANEIADFINKAQVKTYDCPDDKDIAALETYLTHPQISQHQSIELRTIKAQGLICIGQYSQAQTLLDALLLDPDMQTNSRSYASAIYQIGFILDVQEDPKRCGYYEKAQTLAQDKFNDIYLSSQLGRITVCDDSQDVGIKLGQLYVLLESFLLTGDQESVAHIHNNIGLLYGSIGQNALAAEQYEKAYKIGLKVYEEKNQLAPLLSLISANMGSGDFDSAKMAIDELERANLQVNTPLTNSWLHFSQTRYFYQMGDYELMRNSMWKWQVYLPQVSNKQMDSLFEWYNTVLCMVEQNSECVQSFLSKRAEEDAIRPSRLANNKDYLRFLVEANLFLGDIEKSQEAFSHYSKSLTEKMREQQSSARVLGVAKLHGEIITLEANLAKVQKQHIQSMIVIVLIIALLFVLAYFTLGRKYLRKLATDNLTGLRSEQAVLAEIKRVKKPIQDKVNALAVFNMTNFTAVNSQFGYLKGDELLKHVALCLSHVTRDRDIVGRLGVGQFVVCLKNIDDSTANELFERIQNVLADVVLDSGNGDKINVHSSTSIYLAQDSFSDIEQVLEEMRQVEHKNTHLNVSKVINYTEPSAINEKE